MPKPAADAQNEPIPKEDLLGTLVIVVLKGQHLIDNHTFYKQDPYVRLALGGITKSTPVDPKGGQHPVWDAELRVPIAKDCAKENRVLELSCWSEERREDQLLGEAELDISETLRTGEFDDWVPLKLNATQRGEVYLEMTFFAAGPAPLQRRPSKLPHTQRLARPDATAGLNYANKPQLTASPDVDPASRSPPRTVPSGLQPHKVEQQPLPATQANLAPRPGHTHSPSRSPLGKNVALPTLSGEAPPPAALPSILRPGPAAAAGHARYPSGTHPHSPPRTNGEQPLPVPGEERLPYLSYAGVPPAPSQPGPAVNRGQSASWSAGSGFKQPSPPLSPSHAASRPPQIQPKHQPADRHSESTGSARPPSLYPPPADGYSPGSQYPPPTSGYPHTSSTLLPHTTPGQQSQPPHQPAHYRAHSAGSSPQPSPARFNPSYSSPYPPASAAPGYQAPPTSGYYPPPNQGYQAPQVPGYQPPQEPSYQPSQTLAYQPSQTPNHQAPPTSNYQPLQVSGYDRPQSSSHQPAQTSSYQPPPSPPHGSSFQYGHPLPPVGPNPPASTPAPAPPTNTHLPSYIPANPHYPQSQGQPLPSQFQSSPYYQPPPTTNDAPGFFFPVAQVRSSLISPSFSGPASSYPYGPPPTDTNLPDPYLQKRYQTPLPLPPSPSPYETPSIPEPTHTPHPAPVPSISAPTHTPGPPVDRDELAARDAQRIQSEAARRQREQEERDAELARRLDLELNV